MLSVDPTLVLTTLIDRGGLLIPDSAEADLQAVRNFLHVEKAEMNVVEKHLILHNFWIGIKGEAAALRIGRVYVRWGSYIQPCLNIEVDDVEVFVEFMNLLLTEQLE
jgi:hypothetical protein